MGINRLVNLLFLTLSLMVGHIHSMSSLKRAGTCRVKARTRTTASKSKVLHRPMTTINQDSISEADISQINDPKEFVKTQMDTENALLNLDRDPMNMDYRKQINTLNAKIDKGKPWWMFWKSSANYNQLLRRERTYLYNQQEAHVQKLKKPLSKKLDDLSIRGLELGLMRKRPYRDIDTGKIDHDSIEIVTTRKYDEIQKELRGYTSPPQKPKDE